MHAKFWIWLTFFSLPVAFCIAGEKVALIELDSGGRTIESGTKYELLLERDALGNPVSFQFAQTSPTECTATGCISAYRTEVYQVAASRADSCGDASYLAMACTSGGGKLEVVDHTKRTCEWTSDYRWEAHLTVDGGARRFIGK